MLRSIGNGTAVRGLALALTVVTANAVLMAAPPPTAPTTKPAKPVAAKPAAPTLSPRDSVLVESKSAAVTFRVPKTWTAQKLSSSGIEADAMFYWDAAAKAPGKRSGPPPQAHAMIIMNQPCHADETLEHLVAIMRDEGLKANPPVTLTHDQPIEFAGNPAWLMGWETEESFEVTDRRNGKTTVRKEPYRLTHRKTLCIKNGRVFQLTFNADVKRWPLLEREASQVMASFEWTSPGS